MHLFDYILNPRNRVIHEKLTVTHIGKRFLLSMGPLTKAQNLTLFWTSKSSIHSHFLLLYYPYQFLNNTTIKNKLNVLSILQIAWKCIPAPLILCPLPRPRDLPLFCSVSLLTTFILSKIWSYVLLCSNLFYTVACLWIKIYNEKGKLILAPLFISQNDWTEHSTSQTG